MAQFQRLSIWPKCCNLLLSIETDILLSSRLKRLAKVKPGKVPAPSAKFLPTHGDYSLRALINPEAADKEETVTVRGGPFGGPGMSLKLIYC